jgi:hypothetical protein
MKTLQGQEVVHRTAATAFVVMLLLALAAPAFAFQITGRVINGTTNQPVHPATIRILNPSGGMLLEKEAQTLDESGRFVADDLGNNAPVYLLRVDYQGVTYTQMVQPQGQKATAEVTVFEPTVSWNDVHVAMPHVILSRSNDTLRVQKFVQIVNHTSPPRSVYGPESRFTFYMPEDMLGSASIQVQSLAVPLPASAEATDEPGFYTIDYPIRPGQTQVSIELNLPYDGSQYHYTDKFKYPVGEMMLITDDPTMTLTGATGDAETVDDFHGFTGLRLADLGPDKALDLTVQGGSAVARSTAQPQVLVLHSQAFAISIILMILLVIAMLGMLATAAARVPAPAAEREGLEQRKDAMLDQLARLDDLYKTGTVSETIYKMKRTELVNALAHLYHRLRSDGPKSSRKSGRREDPARV